jgi:hypothetical protein
LIRFSRPERLQPRHRQPAGYGAGRARARPCSLEVESSRPLTLAAGFASLALGVAATWLFMASPSEFHYFAQEDRPLEWLSALFLLGASALFAFESVRRRRDAVGLVCAGLLCLPCS